jgi:hypothetical protein
MCFLRDEVYDNRDSAFYNLGRVEEALESSDYSGSFF